MTRKRCRVTETSASTIDLILSNTPENIVSSGVSHVGISDHSLIYAVRKFVFPKSKSIMREVRDFSLIGIFITTYHKFLGK